MKTNPFEQRLGLSQTCKQSQPLSINYTANSLRYDSIDTKYVIRGDTQANYKYDHNKLSSE